MANPSSKNRPEDVFSKRALERCDHSLEWDELMDILEGYAQSPEAKESVSERPKLKSRLEVEEKWRQVDPLKLLAKEGYVPSIGELPNIPPLIKSAHLGQVLDGPELRAFFTLLESTQKTYQFAKEWSAKAPVLQRIKGHLLPIPHLQKEIAKAVGPDGLLLDDASEKLTSIRRQKVAIRRRIEDLLSKLLQDVEVGKYLQDSFWTVRGERYVLPIRLDGRGRIQGSIRDTSDSGQTLFIEPTHMIPINDQLLEMELEEKLEIARIFRELSEQVAQDSDPILGNYRVLVQLDILTAEALLALEIEAGTVSLSDEPILNLIDARHPLIRKSSGKSPVGHTADLQNPQTCLIVSGPNAGGKTVVLKTIGLIQRMAQTGLLVPADPRSKIYLFDRIFVEMGDQQNLMHSLSTFSGHLMGLKPIIESATSRDLILLDELAVGTDPETGAAFAASVLEDFADRQIFTVVTTHFDVLKGLALKDTRFRNGSMEFSLKTLKPTYRLILDMPGQSYGLEVAEQIGIPSRILERAKKLKRGGNSADLNSAITNLMSAREDARLAEERLDRERLETEGERLRWNQEIALLKEGRQKMVLKLQNQYEAELSKIRDEFDKSLYQLKSLLKFHQDKLSTDSLKSMKDSKAATEESLKKMKETLSGLSQEYEPKSSLPGKSIGELPLKEGDNVYILPLKKTGVVARSIDSQTVEVSVGMLKMRLNPRDLRLLSPGEARESGKSSSSKKEPKGPMYGATTSSKATWVPYKSKGQEDQERAPKSPIGLVIQTHLNTLDLRGMDGEEALKTMWSFLDRSLMRGEQFVIVLHGHGEGILKQRIRDALKTECPYDVDYRSGYEQEGGDGVTVVRLNR